VRGLVRLEQEEVVALELDGEVGARLEHAAVGALHGLVHLVLVALEAGAHLLVLEEEGDDVTRRLGRPGELEAAARKEG